MKIQTIRCFKIKSCRLPSRSNALQILDPGKVVLNRPVQPAENMVQTTNTFVGTSDKTSTLGPNHQSNSRRTRCWPPRIACPRCGASEIEAGNLAIHLRARAVKPQADKQRHERTRSGQVTRAHALPAPHFAQRPDICGSVQSIDAKLDTIAYKAFKPLSIDKFVQQRLIGQVMQFLDPSVVPP